jgi:hypothetical protein
MDRPNPFQANEKPTPEKVSARIDRPRGREPETPSQPGSAHFPVPRRHGGPSLNDPSAWLRPLDEKSIRLSSAGWLSKWVALVYGISFFLPVWQGNDPASYGFWAFVMGFVWFLIMLAGLAQILLQPHNLDLTAANIAAIVALAAWLANPVFWFGLASLSSNRCRRAMVLGMIALLLSFSFWHVNPNDVLDLSWGYYLWVTSMALLMFAGWWGQCQTRWIRR